MKEFLKVIALIGIFGITTLLVVGIACRFLSEDYPMTAVVIDVSRANDKVTIKDYNGNLWQYTGVEDYEVGDVVSCIMNNKATESIKDDVIIKVKYSGSFEDWN